MQRRIPSRPGFAWVTCPNYIFEMLAWLCIWLVSGGWTTALFIAVTVVRINLWANKKEGR